LPVIGLLSKNGQGTEKSGKWQMKNRRVVVSAVEFGLLTGVMPDKRGVLGKANRFNAQT
jgi:hypothetical protein